MRTNKLIFSTKTYVVGTQKNRLVETVLLSTQNTCLKLMGKKIFTILPSKFLFKHVDYAMAVWWKGTLWELHVFTIFIRMHLSIYIESINEPWHVISYNVVCATSKVSDQPAHTRSLVRAFASRLNILWVLSYWLNISWGSKLKRRLHRLVWVYTCQNATLLEIICHDLNME